ncbi:MAG: malate synthase A [Xanthomonadales bacterium]|nr:malate synthase A [Xanthomonadales bacterium]
MSIVVSNEELRVSRPSPTSAAARPVLTLPAPAGTEFLLSEAALAFIADLHQRFEPERQRLLQARSARQQRLNAGELPDFLPETAAVRAGDWRVAPIPADLLDRRVEITGPVDRKMVINALNSGARMFMADFEDSSAPTWDNLLQGQRNLHDAVRRQIDYTSPEGKAYQLAEQTATLLVRPRGWHLPEAHVLVDGQPVSGSLFDFALYLFHNGAELLRRGTGPYFYLPKLESHLEARLWNLVIEHAEQSLGLPRGSVRCTVLIETILAVFEMDEILYELRDHIVGLNCGRWDYIFSYIRAFQHDATRVLPERGQVGMTAPFLRAYSQLLIRTCHRRGAFAMGGMAAQIPIKGDAQANEQALAKVRADKEREAGDGHDGTWVAHPGLVPIALGIFDRHLDGPNQLDRPFEAQALAAADLIAAPTGSISEAGVRNNIEVAIRYLAAWLGGSGCVPIHHLMEDAATAEISRAQLWQWARTGARTDSGTELSLPQIEQWLGEELTTLQSSSEPGATPPEDLAEAAELLRSMVRDDQFPAFLTLPAYDRLLARESKH